MSELLKQFELTRGDIFRDIEGVSEEQFSIVPEDLPNSLHWQLGHVLVAAEMFLFGENGQLPVEYNGLFGYGSRPSAWEGDVPSVDTLVNELKSQLERIKEIPTEHFQEKLPEPILGNTTYGELVSFTAYHECTHAGQIHVIKRLLQNK